MAGYKVEICGVNTSKLPLLTNEEKTDLFRRIQNGDTDARETYIKGNLRLVLSVYHNDPYRAVNFWMTCFRSGASGLSRPSIILICRRM